MYNDTELMHLENDIQKIQVKTNMYINEYGEQGAFHLAREIIQNNFDECIDPESPGNTIDISYDINTDILKVSDNGRSFNESKYSMKIFMTTLQSGSKFARSAGVDSSGEFGVGMTVVNALSDYFKVIAYRDKESTIHTLEFKEGVVVEDKIEKNKKGLRGTTVEFRVSKKYMGSDAKLPIDEVINWVDSLFYLNSNNLKKNNIKATITVYDGLDVIKSIKFKPKPFSELINKIIPTGLKKKDLTEVCYINGDNKLIEATKVLTENDDGTTSVDMEDIEKNIHMDIAFSYCINEAYNEPATFNTYCNYTNTIDNGSHLDAFDEAYCRWIQSKVNESMSDTQKNKLKVTWDDCRTNLYCVLSLSTNAQVGFVGNAKQKIQCPTLVPYMKELITNALEEYFKMNSGLLNDIIKIIKINTKARQDMIKAKSATNIEKLNTFKEHEMSNYIRPNNTGKKWKELFLVEGNSASGSARNGSDPDTQGFFLFRGVTLNAMKCSLTDIMENKEWRDLVTVLKCGIGPKFDIDKLYFDRINIFTDSDIDGYNISAGMLAFFYRWMRPIIEAGKLYKVYAPLYSLYDKDNSFVINKSELAEIYHKKIVKNFKIKLQNDDEYLSKDELFDFLRDTFDYSENLIRASKESGNINKFLIEEIISLLVEFGIVRSENDYDDIDTVFSNQKFITKFMNIIQKKFKEIVLEDNARISGVVDGKYALVKITKRFFRKTSYLIPIIQKYGHVLEVKEKDKEPVKMSIEEFLDLCTKLTPKIKTRFKGLGELNGDELFKTTLDINNRISIRYTVDDVERELAIFNLTHGNSKEDADGRKEMMKSYKINREDLDN